MCIKSDELTTKIEITISGVVDQMPHSPELSRAFINNLISVLQRPTSVVSSCSLSHTPERRVEIIA